MRIVVVGSGFGGLGTAIRLQAKGHEVTILEQRNQPGGRAAVFRRDGFVFDAGPTILTAPQLIDELFALAGIRRDDMIRLVPLDPFYRVRFEDGTILPFTGRDDDLLAHIARLAPGDAPGYRQFAAIAEAILDAAFPLIDQPLDSLGAMLRRLPDLVRARAWRSVAAVVEGCVRDPRLCQALSFHPLLIGGHPYRAPAIYALIHALEKRWGVWFTMGGMGALVRALVDVFTRLGGTIRLCSPVAGLVMDARARRAAGVELANGTRVDADAVVCNADVAWAYTRLVPPAVHRPRRARRLARLRHSMSLFVVCFGTDRRYNHMAHHEILMGRRYRELLDDVFDRRVLAPDPSLYLYRPTATDPSLAPPGCDAWYVLAPVPHLGAAIDWTREGDAYRDRIFRYLEDRYLPDLRRHVVTEQRIDPPYFRDELNSHLGTGFSFEPTLLQSAAFRPPHVSPEVPNLYFVGAGTHPGAGIPGVLSSAKIVAEMIGP